MGPHGLVIESCKLNLVNPQRCLTDVLTRLVDGWPQSRIDELMPWHWGDRAGALTTTPLQGHGTPLTLHRSTRSRPEPESALRVPGSLDGRWGELKLH